MTLAQGAVMVLKYISHVVLMGFADGLDVWDENQRRGDADRRRAFLAWPAG